jgi:predicted alpha/beta superfamily hydrolase
MENWRIYADLHPENTVVGRLRVLPDFYSPQLGNKRDLLVYLPQSHDTDPTRRFPVIYMHDGQNLFDAKTSYSGEWRADETMLALEAEGIEAILVGIPNPGADRIHEYSPFADRRSKGRGALYMRFIVETVKPMIDADFHTLPEKAHTGLLGSSMGGLISLYGFFQHPNVFGMAGVVSPAFWFGGGAIYNYVDSRPHVDGRIYLDVGTQEAGTTKKPAWLPPVWRQSPSDRYVDSVRKMRDQLIRKGYSDGGTLHYIEEDGGVHNETDWARRLPEMLRWLLRK